MTATQPAAVPPQPTDEQIARRPSSPYPDLRAVRSMLTQLDADRTQSSYWQQRWAEDGTDAAIEAWLSSLLDWLGGTP